MLFAGDAHQTGVVSVDLLVQAMMARPDESVSGIALGVWRWMAWRADDDSTIGKSTRSIADDLHFAHRTVQGVMGELLEHGLITTLKPSRGRLPTVYRVEITTHHVRSYLRTRDAVNYAPGSHPKNRRTEERGASSSSSSYRLSRAREARP